MQKLLSILSILALSGSVYLNYIFISANKGLEATLHEFYEIEKTQKEAIQGLSETLEITFTKQATQEENLKILNENQAVIAGVINSMTTSKSEEKVNLDN